jgi:hypothetical protein
MNKRLFACVSIWLACIWPQLVLAQEQVRVISSTSVIQAEANQPPLYNVSYHFQGQTYTVQMPKTLALIYTFKWFSPSRSPQPLLPQ